MKRMVVKNLKCENCRNSSMCTGFKTLAKFSEEHSRNPLIPDITMDDCENYVLDPDYGNENPDTYEPEDATVPEDE